MLHVEISDAEIEKILERFDAMAAGLAQLEHTMPEELTDWQREDLRRKRTFTDKPAILVATTKVWSRRGRAKKMGRRRYRMVKRKRQFHLRPSQIMSMKLIEKLHARMIDLVTRSLAPV
jgi:hypothetical protein